MDSNELHERWAQLLPNDDLDAADPMGSYGVESRPSLTGRPTLVTFTGAETSPERELSQSLPETIREDADDAGLVVSEFGEKYHLIKEIGRGGMGVVWLAIQESLDRSVAVKKLHPHLQTPQKEEAFISEALVTGLLAHPNIVTVIELGRDINGHVMLAMERINGKNWDEILHPRKNGTRTVSPAEDLDRHLKILIKVCDAVEFAHSEGIAHLDLKPANVMVGSFGEVLVMDWGLAVNVRDEKSQIAEKHRTIHKTSISNPCGTPCYMAPELAIGDGQLISIQTDVYLLGAILFELMTGSPPHSGPNLISILHKAVMSSCPEFGPHVPRELASVCQRSLQKEPANRIESVRVFREALESYLEHEKSRLISRNAGLALSRCIKSVDAQNPSDSQWETKRTRLYSEFAEAVAGFRQARLLWKDNEAAKTGVIQAHLVFSKTALAFGDLGLAQAQCAELEVQGNELDVVIQELNELQGEIAGAFEERQQHKEALRTQEIETRRTLARLFVEKADRSVEAKDGLRSSAYLAQALTLHNDQDIRERFIEVFSQSPRLLWTSPCRAGALAVAIDKGSSVLVTGGADLILRIWDLHVGTELTQLRGHEDEVRSIEFDPESTRIATGSGDKTVRIWNLRHGRSDQVFFGHEHRINKLQWSSDGRYVVSTSQDHSARIWDIVKNRRGAVLPLGDSGSELCIDRERKWIVVASADAELAAWEFPSGENRRLFPKIDDPVLSICQGPKSELSWDFVTSHGNGSVRYYSIETMNCVGEQKISQHPIIKVMTNLTESPPVIFAVDSQGQTFEIEYQQESKQSDSRLSTARNAHLKSVIANFSTQTAITVDSAQTLRVHEFQTGRGRLVSSGHSARVRGLAVSPDGLVVATGDASGEVFIRQLKTGNEIDSFRPSLETARKLVFHPDTGDLLIAGHCGQLHLCPRSQFRRKNKALKTVLNHKDGLFELVLGPKGEIVTSSRDCTIRISDRNGLKLRFFRVERGDGRALAVSSDGSVLAYSTRSNRSIRLLDYQSGTLVRELTGHRGRLRALAFDVTDTKLASGSSDQSARVWELKTGRLLLTLRGHSRGVRALAWSPDGRRIATASSDRTARIWDSRTGRPLAVLRGHSGGLLAVTWSPDGQALLTTGEDRSVRAWNVSTWNNNLTLPRHEATVRSVSWNVLSNRVATASSDTTVRIYDLEMGQEVLKLRGHSRPVYTVAFHPENPVILASGSNDDTIRIWNTDEARAFLVQGGHHGGIRTIVWHPSGQFLTIGCGDGLIVSRDGQCGEIVREYRGHNGGVSALSWCPDSKYLASGDRLGEIRLWIGAESHSLDGHTGPIYGLQFTHNGEQLVSSSDDGSIYVWDLKSRSLCREFQTELGPLTSIALCPDKRSIAVSGDALGLRVYSLVTGELLREFRGHKKSIRHLAWSPNGRWLASASADQTARIWDLEGQDSLEKRIEIESLSPEELCRLSQRSTGFYVSDLDAIAIPQNRLLRDVNDRL